MIREYLAARGKLDYILSVLIAGAITGAYLMFVPVGCTGSGASRRCYEYLAHVQGNSPFDVNLILDVGGLVTLFVLLAVLTFVALPGIKMGIGKLRDRF